MSDSLITTSQEFLDPAGLDFRDLEKILESMLSHKVDFAEL